MYKDISCVQGYLHNLMYNEDTPQSLAIGELKQPKPVGIERTGIPPKVLSMIFEHLVPQTYNDLTPIQIPKFADVLLSGQICRS